jgi:hypothetical protein
MFTARAITSATAATDTADRIVIAFRPASQRDDVACAKEIALVNER